MKKKPAKRKDRFTNPKFVYVNVDHVYTRRSDKNTGEMLEGGFVLAWGAKGIGCGQMTFHQNGNDVRNLKILCSTEHMGRDFVMKALLHLVKTAVIAD